MQTSILNRLNWGHFWDKYRVDYTRLLALAQIESDGFCFTDTGFPACRFEPHVLYRCLLRTSIHPSEIRIPDYLLYPRFRITGEERNHTEEHNFEVAIHADPRTEYRDCVFKACSWGWAQTLGETWCDATKQHGEAIKPFALSAQGQIKMFEQEMLRSGIWTHLAAGNWTKVALLYNGSARVATYAQRLQSAQKLWMHKQKPEYMSDLEDAPKNAHC